MHPYLPFSPVPCFFYPRLHIRSRTKWDLSLGCTHVTSTLQRDYLGDTTLHSIIQTQYVIDDNCTCITPDFRMKRGKCAAAIYDEYVTLKKSLRTEQCVSILHVSMLHDKHVVQNATSMWTLRESCEQCVSSDKSEVRRMNYRGINTQRATCLPFPNLHLHLEQILQLLSLARAPVLFLCLKPLACPPFWPQL